MLRYEQGPIPVTYEKVIFDGHSFSQKPPAYGVLERSVARTGPSLLLFFVRSENPPTCDMWS